MRITYCRPSSRRRLNKPCGSYLSVSAFQSCGRRALKKLMTFFELRFCAGLHFEQSLWMASGKSSVTEINKTEKKKE